MNPRSRFVRIDMGYRMMTTVEFLSRIPLFSSMRTADIQQIADQLRCRNYGPGEVILRQGENDSRLFMLVRGEVEVVKNMDRPEERTMRMLTPPAYFGEMALIDGMQRSASVVALSNTKVFFLDRLNLVREIERTPTLAVELLRMMSMRIRAIEKYLIQAVGENLPVCLHCGRVHEPCAGWVPIRQYVESHAESDLALSICPECSKERFPQFYE